MAARDPLYCEHERTAATCEACAHADARADERRARATREELYPFPSDEYQAVLDRYAGARDMVWCQEEPQNQGAWYQIRHRLEEPLTGDRFQLLYAGRGHAAAPATGISKVHDAEQAALVEAALHATARESAHRATSRLIAGPGNPPLRKRS